MQGQGWTLGEVLPFLLRVRLGKVLMMKKLLHMAPKLVMALKLVGMLGH